MDKGIPTFGICLGHQMLGLALGGKTKKMAQGHHGANHPVKDLETGKVEIVSMNHGFTVDTGDAAQRREGDSHVSLFDGSNCGLQRLKARMSSVCSIIPRRRPGRWTATICLTASPTRRRSALNERAQSSRNRIPGSPACGKSIRSALLPDAHQRAHLIVRRCHFGADRCITAGIAMPGFAASALRPQIDP